MSIGKCCRLQPATMLDAALWGYMVPGSDQQQTVAILDGLISNSLLPS